MDDHATADRSQIAEVINRERAGKDLGRWSWMEEAFFPNARLGGFWFEGTAEEFIDSSRKAKFGQVHHLGPVNTTIRGSRALAEFNMFIRAVIKVKGVDAIAHTFVRAFDRLEKKDGRWRIHEMNVAYHSADIRALNPWEDLAFDRNLLEEYPRSYRYVAHTLAAHGMTMRKDCLSLDSREAIDALMDRYTVWLQG